MEISNLLKNTETNDEEYDWRWLKHYGTGYIWIKKEKN